MKLLVFICVIFTLSQISSGLRLGDACTDSIQCENGAECKGEENLSPICRCPSGKKQKDSTCIDVLQSDCVEDSDCSNQEGAVCESSKCVCKNGLDPENKKCVVAPSDGTCQATLDCKRYLGDFGVCRSGKCICEENYYKPQYENTCVKSKKLNELCEKDDECVQLIGVDNVLRCNAADKKCVCKDHYSVKGDECSGATRLISTSLVLLASIFLIIKY